MTKIICHNISPKLYLRIYDVHFAKYHLFDYKCRDTKGTGGKFYEDKDCTQLAIEARFLKDTMGLDYDPSITSVCICVESKKHYHKNWTKAQARKGVTRFRYLSKLYWMDWMPKK